MSQPSAKTVRLPCGERVPALGQGTWGMGEHARSRASEIASLQAGLDLGLTLIDTAEMYGDGRTEALVGEAIAGRRDEVFLVSKVYPHNASRRGMHSACTNSLRRLKTDRIDLYLLHWAGSVPIAETVESFQQLQREGHIRHWGVSNLDLPAMQELWSAAGGQAVQTNQLLYNLTRRGIEWDLLPWQRERGIPTMAYSPIEQGRLLKHRGLAQFAQRHGMTPAQAALAWLLAQDDVIAIPKTASAARLRENIASARCRCAGATRCVVPAAGRTFAARDDLSVSRAQRAPHNGRPRGRSRAHFQECNVSFVKQRLLDLGITLPSPPNPAANYVPAVRSGNQLFIAGQVPVQDGKAQFIGKLGAGLSIEQGQQAARLCAINVLAQVANALDGDLDRVVRCVRVAGFVNAVPDFTEHPLVINGASDLFVAVFGEAGRHARTSVGAGSLPRGVAVEVEAVFEVR
jgi:diketogulonate reductase-like aldo/keto reductase/enamine deaminase RidA (YjgF/YER057c/UK114 family)